MDTAGDSKSTFSIIFTIILCFPYCRLLHELWSGKAKHLTSSYFQHLYQLSIAEKEIIRG